jgi:hypothetical protein
VQLTDIWLSAKDFQKVQEFARQDMLNAALRTVGTKDEMDVKFVLIALPSKTS